MTHDKIQAALDALNSLLNGIKPLLRSELKLYEIIRTALIEHAELKIEVVELPCSVCGETACNIASNHSQGITYYDQGQKIIHNSCLALLVRGKAELEEQNKELLEALKYAHSQMQPFCDDTIVKQAIARAEKGGK